jgi:hypothetical protein
MSFRMDQFNYSCINLPLNLIKLFIPYLFFYSIYNRIYI